MDEYRGYEIRVTREACWHAVLVDTQSGDMLPTKATALLREGRGVALRRAQALADLYLAAMAGPPPPEVIWG